MNGPPCSFVHGARPAARPAARAHRCRAGRDRLRSRPRARWRPARGAHGGRLPRRRRRIAIVRVGLLPSASPRVGVVSSTIRPNPGAVATCVRSACRVHRGAGRHVHAAGAAEWSAAERERNQHRTEHAVQSHREARPGAGVRVHGERARRRRCRARRCRIAAPRCHHAPQPTASSTQRPSAAPSTPATTA